MVLEVVQVSRTDLMGGRFNGFSIRRLLEEHGVRSSHLVFERRSDDPTTHLMFSHPGARQFVAVSSRLEQRMGLQSMLQLQSFGLPANRWFRRADVVHYHIIHDGFFSLSALPLLSRLKPSVWTWHDPWPMTGHCIQPMECERWRTGCGECPDLARPFAMKVDKTRQAFGLKRRIVRNSPIDVVVASQWMLNMARRSPIAAGARLHHVPFGVDLKRFAPRDGTTARDSFGIPPDRVVVAVRGFLSPYKGIREFASALELIKTPLCVLSMNDEGGFDRLIGRHQIIALDWTYDEDIIIDAYSAADFFVMPSTAEAFGLMAIEAMACGKPIVAFEGTALPEVTFAPEVGIAVPMRDIGSLANAVQHLVDDVGDRLRRGRRAREIAEKHYSSDLYAGRLATLYRSVAAGRVERAGDRPL